MAAKIQKDIAEMLEAEMVRFTATLLHLLHHHPHPELLCACVCCVLCACVVCRVARVVCVRACCRTLRTR
jgi:hypothetical protein